jgi:Schlafen, AlbA_2
MIQLTEQDILLRLSNTEDSFVERKTVNDTGDCLKTVVAFANTVPIGYPAILFVGVRNNGEPEEISDLDKLQRKLSAKIEEAYPLIYTTTHVLAKDGKRFLAVIVPGSEGRPHFAGQAYIRDGSKSIPASEIQFNRLIAERLSKTYEILRWKGKSVTLTQPLREHMVNATTNWVQPKHVQAVVLDCTQHYVTLTNLGANNWVSHPLTLIELSYDNGRKRLELRLLKGPIPNWGL